ncbi:dystroglycan-like [Dorcoceras hygrometricum]|uniref:Dystroglycan-like n=1 Tax=Dorcoceras hygrometricum TaxID=472368 RepID=A0A2Z7DDG4_9LAMI|nr:dystroglycan-like [Dorcoceras hygrometricum]
MSSWNKANLSLYKLYESQKQLSDKTGIGFNNSEFCEGESSTQSRPAYDKFNKMSFVKADMMYKCLDSVKYDNQNSPKLNENGKAGIGFSKPERLKPDWLKNRLDKDKAKASQKPFVPNQSWHNSKKVKSGWKMFQQRRDQYDQSIISNHLLFAMAASFYSNSIHVDFDSVLEMDEPGMVSMFQALVASGLQGFLGCTAVVYEEALVEFFANGRVRDGLVVSLVDGVIVEISEKLFAEMFELPVVGLADVSEMPKDKIFDARSIVSMTGEPVLLSGSKSQMKMPFRLLCDILAKSISVKAGSFNALTVEKFSLLTAVVCDVKMNWGSVLLGILKKMVTLGSKQAKGFAIQLSLIMESFHNLKLGESSEFPPSKILTEKTTHRYIAIIDKSVIKKKRTIKKKSISSLSTLELVAVAEEALPIQQVAEPSAVQEPRCPSADDVDLIIQQVLVETREADAPADKAQSPVTEEKHWFDLPYDDLVAQWEAERPVVTASDTDEEIATIDVAPADGDQQVQVSVAPISNDDMLSADERMSLPRIPIDDKGKEILVDKDPVKGNPAEEHYSLICADIDLLVDLRAKVIDEVAQFLNSFSLKKLATINFEEMYKKEERVLYWGETESPQVAIQRKVYILLKYRTVLVWKFLEAWRANFAPVQGSSAVDIQVIELLSDLYLCFLEELAKEARAHGLTWTKPCCSKIFEGSPRDRGAIISRNNTHTPSRCWIRTMLYVNGEWIVEPCADRWVKIPQLAISTEVPHQRQYDDTLPTVSVFFKLMTKRWADVCRAVVEFCSTQRLLPVGSLQFCRSLQLVEPVSRIAPSRSPVFAFRVSQFCSIFVDFSLFNWIPSADISEFLLSVALDRTVLRSVQIAQSVVPSVQLSLDQHQSSPTTADSSSSLHFDKTDVDATASSIPPISQDLSAALADLQVTLSEQIFEYQSGLSSTLHKIEQSVCDSLRDQADIFRNLSQGARQEARTLDDVQTIRFNEFRKNVLAQNASIFTGLADVRQEVQAVNAKVDIMDSRLNAIQKDAEATKEALSHQLLEFQSQAQENHNVIHAHLSELVDYIHRVNAKVDIMDSRLNAIQKDAEATKEALSHQLLEFQSQAQENHNVIHAHLSELVDYIHRGSADKKGESGSQGLQQPANIQIEGSAVTPTFEQRVEMAQRRIVHTVLNADANRALFARQDAAERDRERRRREARVLKRRRRD